MIETEREGRGGALKKEERGRGERREKKNKKNHK